MAYVIAEPCIGVKDNSCVEVCPVDCIHPTPDEPDYDKVDQLYIDPEECIDCDACVEACPVDACFAEDQLPDEWQRFARERGVLHQQVVPDFDDLVRSAEAYASVFDRAKLQRPPRRKLAIVTCMDSRIDPFGLLGLHQGDAHMIRNAGGVITDDESARWRSRSG